MNNNLPMIRRKSFFYKIKEWLKNIFRKEEITENQVEEINKINKVDKSDFVNSIKAESNNVILSLQRKLENGEIKEKDLTDKELIEMIKLYKKQIEEKKDILRRQVKIYKNNN